VDCTLFYGSKTNVLIFSTFILNMLRETNVRLAMLVQVCLAEYIYINFCHVVYRVIYLYTAFNELCLPAN
jgi:hypothetical protein